jgi:hypothetical protein
MTFVKNKQFANTADHHHDDRLSGWLAAPIGAQEMLVSADPSRFFRPPYRGWLGVYLDEEVDWDELAAMVERAYRQVAPKRLVAELEAGRVWTLTRASSAGAMARPAMTSSGVTARPQCSQRTLARHLPHKWGSDFS